MLALVSARLLGAEPPPIPNEPAREKAHPPSIALWSEGAPGSEARRGEPERVDWRQEPDIVFPVTFNIHQPSLTPYLPARDKATGCAVIIAPGGGHMFLTMDREGYDLAERLAARGIAAFVLKYRLARDRAGNSPYAVDREPRADALRAVRLVRSRAGEWGIKPDRVGTLGFSAGGVPALAPVLHADAGNPGAADRIERQSARASFHALIYAEVPRGELEIPKETSPAFLVVTYDDKPKVVPLVRYWSALEAAKVPAELHVYSTGGHGFGVRERPLAVTGWPDRFVEWLRDQGMLQ